MLQKLELPYKKVVDCDQFLMQYGTVKELHMLSLWNINLTLSSELYFQSTTMLLGSFELILRGLLGPICIRLKARLHSFLKLK